MHPKIGDEPTLLGFNCGFYSSKENQSHPNGIAESYLNTLPTNIRNRSSMLIILALAKPIEIPQKIMICFRYRP
jgi:hypothetical protein